ncbi:MAG: cytochrome c biogenesis protein CcsA [Bryobacteraceae bacterium]
MREKILYTCGFLAAVLLIRNLYVLLLQLPDEADQGPVYRILFYHVPAWFTSGVAIIAALAGSVMYLVRKDLWWDTLAVAATEVAVAFITVGLVTGSIWGRIAWGIWWTWDARLTSALVLWLLYFGYLILRTSIEDPTARARISAVFSIFAFADVPIVWYSIEWFRTQHPAPVLRGDGYMDPAFKAVLYLNWPALMLLAGVLLAVRMRQEERRREIDGLRRLAHSM